MAKKRAGTRTLQRERSSARSKRVPARLREYQKKRDFSITSEPAPEAAEPTRGPPTFMIHKHDATRLHYDLRLEMGGALASWSVPKGPSFDPAVKRLAIQTEDHPLEYGGFEGRIPDGEYGAGDSLIWDRGVYETVPPGQAEEQRRKGRLHVVFMGEKLKGGFHLIRSGRPQSGKAQWLLFKAKDDTADPKRDIVTERPESVVSGRVATRGPVRVGTLRGVHPAPDALLKKVFPPMLATLAGGPEEVKGEHVYEVKYDGYRAFCAMSGGRVQMWTRNALDLNARFPHIAKALSRIVVGEAVIDGEICILDPEGISRFQLMQAGNEDAVLFAFDLLWLDGQDLRGRPLEERRDLLSSLLSNTTGALRLSERIDGPADRALAEAAKRGLEGVLAKLKGSVYEARRSRAWLKLKAQKTQELAIAGYTPSKKAGGTPSEIGALLLAVKDRAGAPLRWAGKVGTGFSSKLRRQLLKDLSKDKSDKPRIEGAPRLRDAVWVEPHLVAQVEFTEWTEDGKLRHPSFQGLREDKKPEECVLEGAGSGQPAAGSNSIIVKLSNPDRMYYPKQGITKQDIAAYYEAVSGPLLRALADRPLNLIHFSKGIGDEKGRWIQQNIGNEAEEWMRLATVETRTSKRGVRHLVADRPEALRWMAQHAVLEIHPWHSRVDSLSSPDWVAFDLDPAEGRGIEQAIDVALALRGMLERLGIPSLPKTSGKRGLHVYVPLQPGHTYDDALSFALEVGKALERLIPGTTLERALSKRAGRLYIDCMQNAFGKTLVAAYSPRGADGAQVSAPLRWSEVTADLDPSRYTVKTMPARLREVGDLFAPALEAGVRLPRLKR